MMLCKSVRDKETKWFGSDVGIPSGRPVVPSQEIAQRGEGVGTFLSSERSNA